MANNHTEAILNEKSGWKTVTEAEFYSLKVTEAQKVIPEAKTQKIALEENEDREALAARYEEITGKKPHHRLGIDSIKAFLNGSNI